MPTTKQSHLSAQYPAERAHYGTIGSNKQVAEHAKLEAAACLHMVYMCATGCSITTILKEV